jgi:hypothetical protein
MLIRSSFVPNKISTSIDHSEVQSWDKCLYFQNFGCWYVVLWKCSLGHPLEYPVLLNARFWKIHCWRTLRGPHFAGDTPRDTQSWILITIYMLHKASCWFLLLLMWPFYWCFIIHVKNIWRKRCCNFPMLKQERFIFHVCSSRPKYFYAYLERKIYHHFAGPLCNC